MTACGIDCRDMKNRVRQARKQAGLSPEALAEAAGLSKTSLMRLERNETQSMRNIAAVSKALGVSEASLLVTEEAGLSEDAAPYDPGPEVGITTRALGANQSFYRVKTNVLDRLNIRRDDVLVISFDAEALAALDTGDCVLAQATDPASGEAVTILRQFVAPTLLVPNTTGHSPPLIDMEKVTAPIMATVQFVFNRPRAARTR